MLPLPLRGAGSGDGPAPSRAVPRPSARPGVAHHLGLPGRVDGRLPAQGRPWRGDVLRRKAHHAHNPVVDPAPSSITTASATAAVLIGQGGGSRRRSREGRRRGVVGAWRERTEERERRKSALKEK